MTDLECPMSPTSTSLRAAAFAAAASLLLCASCMNRSETHRTGPYLGQAAPGDRVELFAPGVVSTGLAERDLAVSPDGRWILWTVQEPSPTLVGVKQTDDGWSTQEVLPFSGVWADLEPAFSPDGTALFFVSNRPLSDTASTAKDFDIWRVEVRDDGWGTPANLGAPVNREGDEFYPSMARDGSLYFTAEREQGIGKEDIWVSERVDGVYQAPTPLPEPANSTTWEFNACIDPDERFLLYTTYRFGPGLGGGDLYVTFHNTDGSWRTPVSLGAGINSDAIDYCPGLSPDGTLLFFTSKRTVAMANDPDHRSYAFLKASAAHPGNGASDIFWVSAAGIDTLKPSTTN